MTKPIRTEEVQQAIREAIADLKAELESKDEVQRRERISEVESAGLQLLLRGYKINVFLEIRQSETSDELEYA